MNNPLSVLGLAQRAGKIVSGDEGVLRAVRRREAKLVIVAADASEGTWKKYRDKCTFYQIPLIRYGARQDLGKCIGKPERVVIALTDAGFSDLLRRAMPNLERGDEY